MMSQTTTNAPMTIFMLNPPEERFA
jgi:hypothetical protein